MKQVKLQEISNESLPSENQESGTPQMFGLNDIGMA